MTELITPSEYARRRGCSRQAVSQKIKNGGITTVDGLLKPDLADMQWIASTKQLHPDKTDIAFEVVKTAVTNYNFQNSRAKRETHEADLSELKLRQRAGELVEVADVEYALTDFGATLRSLIQQWPDRLAPVLAAESDPTKINATLKAECNELVDELRELAQKIAGSLTDGSSERV